MPKVLTRERAVTSHNQAKWRRGVAAVATALCLAGCAETVGGEPRAANVPVSTPEQLGHPAVREICESVSNSQILRMIGTTIMPQDLTNCKVDNDAYRPGTNGPFGGPLIVSNGVWSQKSTGMRIMMSVRADPLIANPVQSDRPYNQSLAEFEATLRQDPPPGFTRTSHGYGSVYNTSLAIYYKNIMLQNGFEEYITSVSTTGGPYTVQAEIFGGYHDPLGIEGIQTPNPYGGLRRVNDLLQESAPNLVTVDPAQTYPPR